MHSFKDSDGCHALALASGHLRSFTFSRVRVLLLPQMASCNGISHSRILCLSVTGRKVCLQTENWFPKGKDLSAVLMTPSPLSQWPSGVAVMVFDKRLRHTHKYVTDTFLELRLCGSIRNQQTIATEFPKSLLSFKPHINSLLFLQTPVHPTLVTLRTEVYQKISNMIHNFSRNQKPSQVLFNFISIWYLVH